MPRLKILFVASECVPYAKTGGLGDVVGALPRALASRGHDVRVVVPRYHSARRFEAERQPAPLGVPVGLGTAWSAVWRVPVHAGEPITYLLEENSMFDRGGIYGDARGDFGDNLARFAFLSRSSLELCRYLDFVPDVFHVHDWQSSLVPVYLNTVEIGSALHPAATVLTIHNMGYQGMFPLDDQYQVGLPPHVIHAEGVERDGRLNLLAAGIRHATLRSTVSPRYAMEIQTPHGGEGLDGLLRHAGGVIGVLNGIDDRVWNPETDPHLPARYSAADLSGKAECKRALQREMGLPERADVPLLGIVSRLAHQKGIDILATALDAILGLDVQLVLLGAGEGWAERTFTRLSVETDRVRAYIGMSEPLAHRIEAGSDLFLMPSRYEPCGLNQMYSQRYGTLPVVRAVGGLDDTVNHDVTGFKFGELTASSLAAAVSWAVHTYRYEPLRFRAMQRMAMAKPMGWSHAARQYEALYRLAIRKRRSIVA
jgi:starch synthase